MTIEIYSEDDCGKPDYRDRGYHTSKGRSLCSLSADVMNGGLWIDKLEKKSHKGFWSVAKLRNSILRISWIESQLVRFKWSWGPRTWDLASNGRTDGSVGSKRRPDVVVDDGGECQSNVERQQTTSKSTPPKRSFLLSQIRHLRVQCHLLGKSLGRLRLKNCLSRAFWLMYERNEP